MGSIEEKKTSTESMDANKAENGKAENGRSHGVEEIKTSTESMDGVTGFGLQRRRR